MRSVVRRTVFGLSAVTMTVALTTLTGGQAQAAPALTAPALTIAEAKAQVQQLQMGAAALDQKSDGVNVQIAATKADLVQRKADLATQTAEVATLRTQLGKLALAEFQNRNLDTRAQLFITQDTQGFLSQMSTVQKVSDNQAAALQNYQAQQANLSDMQRAEAADLAGLQTNQTQLATLRAESDQKIADAQTVLAKLTEEQRQKIAAEEKKQEAAARKAAEAAVASNQANARIATPATTSSTGSASNSSSSSTKSGGSSSTASSGSSTASSGSSTGSSGPSTGSSGSSSTASTATGSGKGAKALAFALSQRGKPYVFGAEGPGSYDCSGLTLASWRAAGVSLDRTAASQFHDGVPVAKSDLRPGDLVFFYSSSSPSHVAIYAGNGYVVHAPHPGASVTLIKMSYMPYSGARRPG